MVISFAATSKLSESGPLLTLMDAKRYTLAMYSKEAGEVIAAGNHYAGRHRVESHPDLRRVEANE